MFTQPHLSLWRKLLTALCLSWTLSCIITGNKFSFSCTRNRLILITLCPGVHIKFVLHLRFFLHRRNEKDDTISALRTSDNGSILGARALADTRPAAIDRPHSLEHSSHWPGRLQVAEECGIERNVQRRLLPNHLFYV